MFTLTKEGRRAFERAVRKVADKVAAGERFGRGTPFCDDGMPNCVMGHVLVLAGYKAYKDKQKFVEVNNRPVDVYKIFHAAIRDNTQAHMQDVARIWRNNDSGNWPAVAEALNDFAGMIEQTL